MGCVNSQTPFSSGFSRRVGLHVGGRHVLQDGFNERPNVGRRHSQVGGSHAFAAGGVDGGKVQSGVVGAQFPVVVTDSSGITDLSGNAWNLNGSSDRVFGPQGN